MIFDSEVLKSDCIEDLCQFGIENDGIKCMVFTGDALQFSLDEEAISNVHEILMNFNGDNMTKLVFRDNGLKNS
jgi:hypothetical protein